MSHSYILRVDFEQHSSKAPGRHSGQRGSSQTQALHQSIIGRNSHFWQFVLQLLHHLQVYLFYLLLMESKFSNKVELRHVI